MRTRQLHLLQLDAVSELAAWTFTTLGPWTLAEQERSAATFSAGHIPTRAQIPADATFTLHLRLRLPHLLHRRPCGASTLAAAVATAPARMVVVALLAAFANMATIASIAVRGSCGLQRHRRRLRHRHLRHHPLHHHHHRLCHHLHPWRPDPWCLARLQRRYLFSLPFL